MVWIDGSNIYGREEGHLNEWSGFPFRVRSVSLLVGEKKKKKDGLSDGRMIGDLPFFCFFVFFFLRLSVFWFVVVVLFLLSSVALLTVVDAYYG